MAELLAPGVVFETVDSAAGALRRLPTDVAAFVGIAERGALDQPVAVDSWAAFRATFGGPLPNGFLAYAVKAFFENGGRRCYAVRVAADSAATAALELVDPAGNPSLRFEASSPGSWGDRLEVRLRPAYRAAPTGGEAVELDLVVLHEARPVASYRGLSLVPESSRWIERVLAGSPWLRVQDLGRGGAVAAQARMPTAPQRGLLAGGRDGIAALTPLRFVGEPGEAKRGLRALEAVDEVSLVAIPDLFVQEVPTATLAPRPAPPCDPCLDCCDEPPAALPLPPQLVERAPTFPLEEVFVAQQALVLHCETLRDRVAILDPPPVAPGAGLAPLIAWRQRFDSSWAALYAPWVRVADPLPGALVRQRLLPPSGHVVGLIARTDRAVGVHKAPANAELRWLVGLAQELGEREQEVLNPLGINAIRAFPGRGLRVYGARTLASETQLRYLPVRRLLAWIAETLEESLAWAVFEPHTATLRQAIAHSIESFLAALWARGALAGARAEEAFRVRCDASNNPQEAVDRGELLAEIGVAPTVPAEFVLLRVGRTEDSFVVTTPERGL
jgi:uncharacterized protein